MTATTISPSSAVLPEKGTGIIKVEFKDEDRAVVTPNADTIKWTLTDRPPYGGLPTVINSRLQVAISSLSTIYIVLKGDDLALLAGEVEKQRADRVILVEYQYDSTIQTGLDDKAQHVFEVENLYHTT